MPFRSVRLLLVLLLALLPGSVLAATRAVVVGVDGSAFVPALEGAVADARDIAEALRRRGVEDVVVLLDGAATRDAVLGAIDAATNRIEPGDLMILTFAGHGAREAWGRAHPPGVREGDRHDVFLSAGFAPPGVRPKGDGLPPGSARERIWGAEIDLRLARLERAGARTIFVADTSHGGGLTRSPLVADGVAGASYRVVPAYAIEDGDDPLAPEAARLPAPIDTDATLADLTRLTAVDRTHKAPEVPIPRGSGTLRGALSHAFARAVDGEIATAKPGLLTRGELMDFVHSTVRTLSDNRQDPDLRPRAGFDRVVIDFDRDMGRSRPSGSTASAPPVVAAIPPVPVVNLQTHRSTVRSVRIDVGEPIEMKVVGDGPRADLLYDGATGAVHTAAGDLVATGVSAPDLVDVAAREVAIRRLVALATPRPHAIRLARGDKRYVAGDKVSVDVRPLALRPEPADYAVLFNITGTGRVQFLHPFLEKGDPPTLPVDRPLDAIEVVPPFGTDTIVLITSKQPLWTLITTLRNLDGRPAARAAVDAVAAATRDGVRIGLQRIYTAATAE